MTETFRRVGFWPRFAATAIDYGIIAGLCAILGASVGGLLNAPAGDDAGWASALAGDPFVGALAGIIVGFALVGALYMSLEAWTAATLGKVVLGLVVVGDDGRPAPAGVRAGRYVVKNCHLLLGAAAGLSGVWFVGALVPLATLVVVAGSTVIFTDEHRALHDVVARTAVVRRPARALNL
ncbi:MAG: RDD family protein [Acidobacteria bacterium]|nr:RDD family protein [Acidobacteriota bacterium]